MGSKAAGSPVATEITSAIAGSMQAKRPLLERMLSRLRKSCISAWARVDRYLLRLAAGSTMLSSLYYTFFSRSFGREHQTFLQGRLIYEAEVAWPKTTSTLLRRNVHRLEKALLMKPRREVFALKYIGSTVTCYGRALQVADLDKGNANEELQWAHDVLSEYFEVCGRDPRIESHRGRFRALPQPPRSTTRQLVPYQRDLSRALSVRYEDLLELAQRRRSVRWYLRRPVPRHVIDQAVVVAAQSPSACNRQPFVFRVFDEPALVQRVAAIPMGTEGYRNNLPTITVLVGRMRNFFSERDRHLIYIDGALAAMAFVYAIECQGLSTCCINWPDVDRTEREMAELLRLEPDERPIMLIAVGYPDPGGLVAYSQKKPLDQLRQYNFE